MKDRTLALLGTGSIPYRKELREYTGSVTGSLLMMQLDYWFARHPDGFYKFLDPTPNHPDYKDGDSWTEELGFSKAEFRTAFDAIGIRHSSKSAYTQAQSKFTGKDGEKFYCSYHDKKNGLTWYFRNHPKVEQLITELCKAKPVKHRVKPSSVDKQNESTGNQQNQSPVDKESESTVDVVSESIEVNNVDLHRSTNLTYIDQESESTFYIQKNTSENTAENTSEGNPPTPLPEVSTQEFVQPNQKIPSGQKTESLQQTENPSLRSSVPQPALITIYAEAKDVYELIDIFLMSPDISDASPPHELMTVYKEKNKWSGWLFPWRSRKMDRQFQNCNPEVVRKLARELAQKDKSTPEQKYDHAIATINKWEQTKGGWVNLMKLCDRPEIEQETAAEEKPVIPQYIKEWHDSYHEVLHEKFMLAKDLEDFFKKGKDNRAWYEFAKEKFPSWDWTK